MAEVTAKFRDCGLNSGDLRRNRGETSDYSNLELR